MSDITAGPQLGICDVHPGVHAYQHVGDSVSSPCVGWMVYEPIGSRATSNYPTSEARINGLTPDGRINPSELLDWECEECGRMFVTLEALMIHENDDHDEDTSE